MVYHARGAGRKWSKVRGGVGWHGTSSRWWVAREIETMTQNMTRKESKRVTFGPFERISDIPGDDETQAIYLDGEQIGEIEKGMTSDDWCVYSIGEYNVVLWTSNDEGDLDHGYSVGERGDFATAREAGAAARRYARKTILAIAK